MCDLCVCDDTSKFVSGVCDCVWSCIWMCDDACLWLPHRVYGCVMMLVLTVSDRACLNHRSVWVIIICNRVCLCEWLYMSLSVRVIVCDRVCLSEWWYISMYVPGSLYVIACVSVSNYLCLCMCLGNLCDHVCLCEWLHVSVSVRVIVCDRVCLCE